MKDIRRFLVVATVTLVMAGCADKTSSVPFRMDPTWTYRNGLHVLRQALTHEDPVVRSQAIEALAQTEGIEAGDDYLRGLDDKSPTVRFAAAMAIGEVKYAPAFAKLEHMAEDKQVEPDKRTYCAVLYALYRISGSKRAAELRKLLFDGQKEVRACAALAMGRMGEPTAIEWLESLDRNEEEMSVRLQVAHSLALLNDMRSARLLEGYARSQFLEDRLIAISAMAETGAPNAIQVLRSLMTRRRPQRPPRVRVAAAGALARLGVEEKNAYKLCAAAAEDPRQVLQKWQGATTITDLHVGSLQQIAAISLGWMSNKTDVSVVLYPLLRSENGSVRVAAAMSLLRLFKDFRPIAPQPAPDVPQTQPAKASGRPEQPAQTDKPDDPSPTEAKTSTVPAWRERPKLHTAGGKD